MLMRKRVSESDGIQNKDIGRRMHNIVNLHRTSNMLTNTKPIKKKKRLNKEITMGVKRELLNWFEYSQLHGVHRIIGQDASWYWIPSMLILFLSAVTLVFLAISRFQENPTYLSHLDSGHNRLPFPTVIICPEVHFPSYKKARFLSNLKYPEGVSRSYIWEILPQLGAFFSLDVPYDIDDLANLETFLQYNNIEIETAGRQLTLSCEETLIRCRWQTNNVDCAELFRMDLTGDGFCCVFNGRSLSREIKQIEENDNNLTKWDTSLFGHLSGLMVAVNQSQAPRSIDLNYKWIALEASQRYIDTTINGTALNPGNEEWLQYKITTYKITITARSLQSNLRRCRMSEEPLKYFPHYRKRYCLLECEIHNTMKLCHCVRTSHPNPQGASHCNARQLLCANHATVSTTSSICDCPPTCDVDTKIIRTSSFELDRTVEPVDRFYSGLNYDKVTVVRIYLQNQQKTAKERHSYFNPLDLFSQLGGMFNAFFGCSILTILGFVHRLLRIAIILWRNFLKKLLRLKKSVVKSLKNKS